MQTLLDKLAIVYKWFVKQICIIFLCEWLSLPCNKPLLLLIFTIFGLKGKPNEMIRVNKLIIRVEYMFECTSETLEMQILGFWWIITIVPQDGERFKTGLMRPTWYV